MFVEISHSMNPDDIVMPGNIEKPVVVKRSRMVERPSEIRERDKDCRWGSYNNTSIVKIFAHTGTHIDVPYHVDPKGFKLHDFDLRDFILEHPVFLEIEKGPLEKITVKDLEPYEPQIVNCDALLVYTGFSSVRNTDPEGFVARQPSFSVEAAEYLVDSFNIRAYGIDTIGIENIPEGKGATPIQFPVHKTFLLRKETKSFVIEDMNLKPLIGRRIKRVFVIPLRVFGLEAMPVTAFAEV